MNKLTIQQGESAKIAIALPLERMASVQDIICNIGRSLVYKLSDETLIESNDPNIFYIDFKSVNSYRHLGIQELSIAIDYSDLGIRKTDKSQNLYIEVLKNSNPFNNESSSELVNATVNVVITENLVSIDAEIASFIKGAKGDKGDQGIQGDKGDAGEQGLKGDKGEQGNIGPQGLAGNNGTNGAQGIQGIQGPIGLTGVQGIQGAQGLSAYQVWLAAGNTGTQAQYLASLVGAQGIQGIQGPQGIAGTNGTNGNNGTNGAQGIQGIQGATGASGNTDKRLGSYFIFNEFLTSIISGDFQAGVISSGSLRSSASIVNHPGVIYVRNTGVAGGGAWISTTNTPVATSVGMLPSAGYKFEVILHPVYSSPTGSFVATARIGFLDTPASATDATNGIYIEMNGTASGMSFYGKTASASVRSQTASSYSLAYGSAASLNSTNWHRLVITVTSASLITFEIYNNSNTLVWTDTLTTNIPTAVVNGVLIATSTNTAQYDIISFDYAQITIPALTR